MSQDLREAIRDRANSEGTTQTNLIRTAIRQYLVCPEQQLKSTLGDIVSSDTDTGKPTAKVEAVGNNILSNLKRKVV